MIAFDKGFATWLLYAVDKWVQLFLMECKLAKSQAEVYVKHFDFSNIIGSVLYRTFAMALPATLLQVSTFDVGSKCPSYTTKKEASEKRPKQEKSTNTRS